MILKNLAKKNFLVISKKNLPTNPVLKLVRAKDKFKKHTPTNNETTRTIKILYLMPKIDFIPMTRKKLETNMLSNEKLLTKIQKYMPHTLLGSLRCLTTN